MVEFIALDAIGDLHLLKSLISLIKFILKDNSLKGSAKHQNNELIELASLVGFENEKIKNGAYIVLDAAKNSNEFNSNQLDYLYSLVQSNDSYAVKMKREFSRTNDIIQSISNMYDFSVDNLLEKSA